MISKINIDKIVSIDIFEKKPHKWYEYVPAKKGWFSNKTPYFRDDRGLSSPIKVPVELLVEIEKNLVYIENNKVWWKPHVHFNMANGDVVDLYFETVEDLYKLLNSEKYRLNLLTTYNNGKKIYNADGVQSEIMG